MGPNSKGSVNEESTSNNIPTNPRRSYTLYLIRHGEALHNVQEKAAQEEAKETAQRQGLSPEETERKMELARQRVLEDHSFFDSPLTTNGIKQAQDAATVLYSDHSFPPPTEVFVSPLQRTLQTAAHLFEHHPNIRVREELRERLTGRPADNRYSSSILASRKSFSRFSFANLRRSSMMLVDPGELGCSFEDDDDDDNNGNEDAPDGDAIENKDEGLDKDLDVQLLEDFIEFNLDRSKDSRQIDDHETTVSDQAAVSSRQNVEHCAELEHDMHARASKLLDILRMSHSQSIAVVSHKGYLRALERSVFGQKDAKEFGNCEIRVYKIELDTECTSVESAVRVL